MAEHMRISQLLSTNVPASDVTVSGWVRPRRDSKTFSFLELNDGSCLNNLQVIADQSLSNYNEVAHLTTGSAVTASGRLESSPGKGQKWELRAASIDIIGRAPEDYPLHRPPATENQ